MTDDRRLMTVHASRVVVYVSARGERPPGHGPIVPPAAMSDRQREHGPAVVPERAPTHVIVGERPRHPRGAPGAPRNPEPGVARIAPTAVVMRGPRPRVEADPCPAVRPDRRPRTVGVRAPLGSDRGIPDVSVRRVVLPRPVLIECVPVGLQIRRKVASRPRSRSLPLNMVHRAGEEPDARRRHRFHFGVFADLDAASIRERRSRRGLRPCAHDRRARTACSGWPVPRRRRVRASPHCRRLRDTPEARPLARIRPRFRPTRSSSRNTRVEGGRAKGWGRHGPSNRQQG